MGSCADPDTSETSPHHPEDVAGFPNSGAENAANTSADSASGAVAAVPAVVLPREGDVLSSGDPHGPLQLPPPDHITASCDEDSASLSTADSHRSSTLVSFPLHRDDDELARPVQKPLAHTLSLPIEHLTDSSPLMQRFSSFTFDETISVVFRGRRSTWPRLLAYYAAGACSLGSSLLVCHWFPKLQSRLKYASVSLREATHVFCESSLGTFSFERIERLRDEHDILFRLFDADEQTMAVFEYNYNRFILNPCTGRFAAVQDLPRLPEEVQDNAFSGLTPASVLRQRQLFGSNDVHIQTKSTLEILWSEILHPFNMFQVFSIVVWCFEDYFIYSSIILGLAIISISTTLVEMRKNFARLREMAHFECKVNVVRDGDVSQVSSVDLVPGDTIVLSSEPALSVLPCDLILLNGEIIVDESMLTGESVPITKLSILELHGADGCSSHEDSSHDNDDTFEGDSGSSSESDADASEETSEEVETDLEDQDFAPNQTIDIGIFGKPEEVPNRALLYAGTKIIRSRIKHGREALAIVLNTGLYTAKGNLIQSILFPRPNNFKFHQDSLRFIAFMGILATVSFIFCIVAMARMGFPIKTMMMRALDLITVVVPPALPATMSIGAAFAMARLRKQAIFCISPPKIAVSSTIDRMCFDKTGTLTEEGLRLKGVIATEDLERCQSDPKQLKPAMSRLMATCHSVQSLDDKIVGDPLDVEMLAFTDWALVDRTESLGGVIVSGIIRSKSNPAQELGILKTFEFHSSLRRMTVLVREFRTKHEVHVYCKGSPESIKDVCQPSSLPANYDKIVSQYAHRGYRLLACAGKTVKHLPWLRLKRYSREHAESGLVFQGFLVFENPLKANVDASLKTLHAAGIGSLVCTGDNPLTAICVARACGIMSSTKPVYLASLVADEMTDDITIEFENLDSPDSDVATLPALLKQTDLNSIELAISGAVFEHLTHPEHRNGSLDADLKRIFSHCRVFARMSPQQKQLLVEILQSYGQVIGFCGDGANDCGALKAADVGISLSQAEASIAAPFTSRTMDIACVPTLIKEGRASLSTSFTCFKFMTLYSMVQYTSLSCLFLFRSYLTDAQFIYSDLMMILPLGILLSRFGPAKRLSLARPPSRLVSPEVLSSITSMIALQATSQFINVFASTLWTAHPENVNQGSNLQNTAVFVTSAFMYPMIACLFSFQHPHRQPFYLPFYLFITAAVVFSLGMAFGFVPGFVTRFFSLNSLRWPHALQISLVVLATFSVAALMEFAVLPAVISATVRRRSRGRISIPSV